MSREQTSKVLLMALLQCIYGELTHWQGEGIEFLENSPYTDDKGPGFYTHKVVHLEKYVTRTEHCFAEDYERELIAPRRRLPGWVRALLPASALRIEEKCA